MSDSTSAETLSDVYTLKNHRQCRQTDHLALTQFTDLIQN